MLSLLVRSSVTRGNAIRGWVEGLQRCGGKPKNSCILATRRTRSTGRVRLASGSEEVGERAGNRREALDCCDAFL